MFIFNFISVVGIFLTSLIGFLGIGMSFYYEKTIKIPQNQITIIKTKNCVHVDIREPEGINPVTFKEQVDYNEINDSTTFYYVKSYDHYDNLKYSKIIYKNIKK